MSTDPEQPDGDLIEPGELDELRSAVSALRGQLDRGLHGAARESDADKDHGAAGADGAAGSDGAAEQEPLLARLGGEAAQLGQRVREQLEELDVMALFNDLRKRLSFLPVRDSEPEVDEFGVDKQALASAGPVLDFLFERWWRVRVAGLDQVPRDARVLFVANRSGVLPYDGLMVAHSLARAFGESRRPRFLIADWLAGLPFAQSLLAGFGGVRACTENAERLLRSGHWVIAFPEGQKGALKLFHDRYRLQRFARGGFVSIALRENAVIVPVGVVGAEEVHPVLYESPFASRLLGVPALLTPTFPHLGPLGLVPLPSQWHIRFGEPISFAGVAAGAADDPLFVNRTTARIRRDIQRLIDDEVRSRRSVF